MPAQSLTVVLPAYNEKARPVPVVDDLLGYLHRRGDHAGAPGVDASRQTSTAGGGDGSSEGTAALVRSGLEFASGELELLELLGGCRTASRAPRSRPGCSEGRRGPAGGRGHQHGHVAG